jgi:site-specific DNA-methyltransferase (adenine-specific)
METNKIIQGDCLEVMPNIPDKSIDMILCDLPYGTTACKWDIIIPFEPLWKQYKRIIKDKGAIVLTASQPFTSMLIMSNLKMFKYEWIYKKRCASNFAQAKYAPMKEHENIILFGGEEIEFPQHKNILVFGEGKVRYYPIKEERQGSGKERAKYAYSDKSRHASGEFVGNIKGDYDKENDSGNDELRYPSSVQEFNNRASGDRGLHPTQKPVLLFEYLIKTYTNKGDLVLDNCAGSGTTGVACKNLGRKYIGIEISEEYCEIARKRINQISEPLF